MAHVTDYTGNLLSHVATVYRQGERNLVIEFVETLGCNAAGSLR